ncbi:sterile alpha motif domain-containing protein 13 isoform X2 [Natator depressus]|uniref:sterile alpha motif domain-containing protein 13 isoform X2 n=1 Tax=Natator depressus TaxID=27790 RepID=UPI003EB6B325
MKKVAELKETSTLSMLSVDMENKENGALDVKKCVCARALSIGNFSSAVPMDLHLCPTHPDALVQRKPERKAKSPPKAREQGNPASPVWVLPRLPPLPVSTCRYH